MKAPRSPRAEATVLIAASIAVSAAVAPAAVVMSIAFTASVVESDLAIVNAAVWPENAPVWN